MTTPTPPPDPVFAFPQPRLRNLCRPVGRAGGVLEAFTSLHLLCRCAIHWAVRGLNLPPDSVVWCPSYHCGVEIQAARDAGARIGYYRIAPDLTIDEADLRERLRQAPGPVMIIHYFGFPQPGVARLAAYCRREGLPLIEDCAHALFSSLDGQRLGWHGTLGAFSLSKTFGLNDGGALRVDPNFAAILGRPFRQPPPGQFSVWAYRRGVKRAIRDTLGPEWSASVRAALGRGHAGSDGAEPAPPNLATAHLYPLRMTAMSRRMVTRTDPARICDRRRRHFQMLDELLTESRGYRPVFGHLPDEVTPLFLPIWVDGRREVMRRLDAQRLQTFVFGEFHHPEMNQAEFPESAALRDRILCLPIHQDMNEQKIERLARALAPLLARDALD